MTGEVHEARVARDGLGLLFGRSRAVHSCASRASVRSAATSPRGGQRVQAPASRLGTGQRGPEPPVGADTGYAGSPKPTALIGPERSLAARASVSYRVTEGTTSIAFDSTRYVGASRVLQRGERHDVQRAVRD